MQTWDVPTARPAACCRQTSASALRALQQADAEADRFEYEVFDRTLQCVLLHLPAQGVFHCYLVDVTEHKEAEAHMRQEAFHDA